MNWTTPIVPTTISVVQFLWFTNCFMSSLTQTSSSFYIASIKKTRWSGKASIVENQAILKSCFWHSNINKSNLYTIWQHSLSCLYSRSILLDTLNVCFNQFLLRSPLIQTVLPSLDCIVVLSRFGYSLTSTSSLPHYIAVGALTLDLCVLHTLGKIINNY